MHTHNVNVKTATEESSRKMGGKDTPEENARRARILLRKLNRLQEGITVFTASASAKGDVQIEIRRFGVLVWHAWSFEPDFLTRLEANLLSVQQN
ncbi:hypothetical protein [Kosakonia radicincitans]|uniref:hypothetical protein n=1 Tax=Kosakonia radicincitans TaxID=283686 RepID=UPI0023689B39|nr:hypothetical protein [Kosakonia radicincitans]MDD7997459.1 hypothetical protein [Kosakonia radicincitans]